MSMTESCDEWCVSVWGPEDHGHPTKVSPWSLTHRCTVMLILIFNSTAYCHAHSFTFYILFFISYFSFILSYVYFPCVVFSIFALSMERTRLSFHCWLYSLCIVVYVTNKTWNLISPVSESFDDVIHCRWWDLQSLCKLTLRNVVFKVFHNLFTHSFTDWRASAHLYFWETLPL